MEQIHWTRKSERRKPIARIKDWNQPRTKDQSGPSFNKKKKEEKKWAITPTMSVPWKEGVFGSLEGRTRKLIMRTGQKNGFIGTGSIDGVGKKSPSKKIARE